LTLAVTDLKKGLPGSASGKEYGEEFGTLQAVVESMLTMHEHAGGAR
jgi:hypothetical protein